MEYLSDLCVCNDLQNCGWHPILCTVLGLRYEMGLVFTPGWQELVLIETVYYRVLACDVG